MMDSSLWFRRTDSALSRAVSPAGRIAFAVAWVFAIALIPGGWWPGLLFSATVLAALSFWSQFPWKQLLHRVAVLLPLLALTGLSLVGQPDWPERMLVLAGKATLSLWIMSLLVHATSFDELIGGLRTLKFPTIAIDLLSFLVRYFSVLGEEWRRMQLARSARTFRRHRQAQFRAAAESLGCLFIRAYERAERVHQAMLARGYRGH